MIRHDLPPHAWRKSSFSDETDPLCVEMQPTPDSLVAIGDSKARPRGAFVFAPHTWATFVHSIRKGTLQPTR
ncbi:DUF397 domain-containing protein [Streptomyces roseoverticillatus]|uniref:DUF397 domain-containing protein n=1 Tax=Streptomyces roseoverticillatus TaxID=66429 RepID=A0ABV3IZS5_9ACTN